MALIGYIILIGCIYAINGLYNTTTEGNSNEVMTSLSLAMLHYIQAL